MQLDALRNDLAAASDPALASEMVDAYEELRIRHFRRDFRPGQMEAGRFAEASFRVLQQLGTGKHTPVGKTLPKLPVLIQALESADASVVHESIRLHIPKALAAVYNIRNRRDVGHIASDVDANEMDAEFVMAACNWVLAEFVRLLHSCSPEEARAYVDAIIEREAPLVQLFGDEPFVTATDLAVKDELLVLVYQKGQLGVTLDDLDRWTTTGISRRVISARLSELEHRDRYIRRVDGRILLTEPGARRVEALSRERAG